MRRARQTIVLADHTELDAIVLYRVGLATVIHTAITDGDAPESDRGSAIGGHRGSHRVKQIQCMFTLVWCPESGICTGVGRFAYAPHDTC